MLWYHMSQIKDFPFEKVAIKNKEWASIILSFILLKYSVIAFDYISSILYYNHAQVITIAR